MEMTIEIRNAALNKEIAETKAENNRLKLELEKATIKERLFPQALKIFVDRINEYADKGDCCCKFEFVEDCRCFVKGNGEKGNYTGESFFSIFDPVQEEIFEYLSKFGYTYSQHYYSHGWRRQSGKVCCVWVNWE